MEVLRGGLCGNDRERGTVTILGGNTALDELGLFDGCHGDTAATTHTHTVDDGLLTVGTVTTDRTHAAVTVALHTFQVGQSTGDGTTRRGLQVFTTNTGGGTGVIGVEHRRLPSNHNLTNLVGTVNLEIHEDSLTCGNLHIREFQ